MSQYIDFKPYNQSHYYLKITCEKIFSDEKYHITFNIDHNNPYHLYIFGNYKLTDFNECLNKYKNINDLIDVDFNKYTVIRDFEFSNQEDFDKALLYFKKLRKIYKLDK